MVLFAIRIVIQKVTDAVNPTKDVANAQKIVPLCALTETVMAEPIIVVHGPLMTATAFMVACELVVCINQHVMNQCNPQIVFCSKMKPFYT